MGYRSLIKPCWLIALSIWVCSNVYAQKITRAQYIIMWKDVAQQSMRVYGIPASITLAQACLESADGNSELAMKGKNHFGIKCHGWEGKKIYHDDDKKGECFRRYKHAEQSFEDHALFLSERKRYAALFELKPDDYKAWAKGLKRAGYATNPKYPALLIKIIEDNKLYEYDEEVLKEGKRNRKKRRDSDEADEEMIAEINIGTEEVKTPEELEEAQETDANELEKSEKNKEEQAVDNQEPEFGTSIEVTIGKVVKIHENNVKYVVAEGGDTPELVAQELNLGRWQIEKYNDIDEHHVFTAGEIIFIQPKRNKAKRKLHKVTGNETLWEISQLHAIKLEKLADYNDLAPRSTLQPGDQLFLRKP